MKTSISRYWARSSRMVPAADFMALVWASAPDVCRGVDITGHLDQSDREQIVALARDYLALFQSGKQGG